MSPAEAAALIVQAQEASARSPGWNERFRCGIVAGTMLLTLLSRSAPAASRADPLQLPKAAAQVPAFQQYTGQSLAAGGRYRDPVSKVWITKLTDATAPAPNENGLHHYASGPVQISAEWGAQSHTINVTAAGKEYLVDYNRGGSLSNWRRASFIGVDLTFGFSFNSTTPRLAYYVRDRVLHCYDTEKMARQIEGISQKASRGSARKICSGSSMTNPTAGSS